MEICTFASSSSGNCALVSHGGTTILVDAGISLRRIRDSLRELGLTTDDLSAVLITHEHTDHICAVRMLLKHTRVPIYASYGVSDGICASVPEAEGRLQPFEAGTSFSLRDICIQSFITPHDTPESVGYVLEGGGRRLAFVTDLGCVTDTVRNAVRGADAALVESNHDVRMLTGGRYPYYLKKRILSDRGHLSNEVCGGLAAELAGGGTRRLILAHLSKENNTPQLAYRTAEEALCRAGAVPGRDVALHVAPADSPGGVYIV